MSKTVSEVLDAERAFLQAHLDCDVVTLDRLMAEEYAQIDSRGRVVRKAEVIASFESGARHWDEARTEDLEVRVYGEAAVVIGLWRARGTNSGRAFDYAARYMAVWVRRDGRWQSVSDQSTEIA